MVSPVSFFIFKIDTYRKICYILSNTPPPGGWGGVKPELRIHLMDEETTKIVNRLKSIEGHVRGVEKMVEDGSYCIDIVNQISAIQSALHKVNALVLDKHLHTCVTTAIRGDDPDERERVIDEIMGVFNAKKS